MSCIYLIKFSAATLPDIYIMLDDLRLPDERLRPGERDLEDLFLPEEREREREREERLLPLVGERLLDRFLFWERERERELDLESWEEDFLRLRLPSLDREEDLLRQRRVCRLRTMPSGHCIREEDVRLRLLTGERFREGDLDFDRAIYSYTSRLNLLHRQQGDGFF